MVIHQSMKEEDILLKERGKKQFRLYYKHTITFDPPKIYRQKLNMRVYKRIGNPYIYIIQACYLKIAFFKVKVFYFKQKQADSSQNGCQKQLRMDDSAGSLRRRIMKRENLIKNYTIYYSICCMPYNRQIRRYDYNE